MTITLGLDKETKATWRYRELDAKGKPLTNFSKEHANLGALYLRKTAVPNPPPDQISVTISW